MEYSHNKRFNVFVHLLHHLCLCFDLLIFFLRGCIFLLHSKSNIFYWKPNVNFTLVNTKYFCIIINIKLCSGMQLNYLETA